ncbi:MAG: heavy-metal-associated domain-containing protein [Ruminococcaceae bacterium]|nr:heavy-metal-associated domain-containing protein [Oscillospiraceae bacterium]
MIVKKSYKLENLDCANCAAKMEERIKKIEGVVSASVSFIMQKLVIEAEEKELEKIVKQAAKICRKVDSDCRVIL